MLRTDTEALISEALSDIDSESAADSPNARVSTPGKPLWDFPDSDTRRTPVMKIGTAESFFNYDL